MSSQAYTIPTVQVAAQDEVSLITMSPLPDMPTRVSILAALLSTFGTKPPTHLKTVELVLNLFHIAQPEMAVTMRAFTTVKVKTVATDPVAVGQWLGIFDPPTTGAPRDLLSLLGPVKPRALAVTDVAAVYAGVASVLFAIGRQASEGARVAALDKRPDALIRKFEIAEVNQVLLPGREAGPSREFLETVYNAFANFSEIRAEIVRFLIGVKRSMDHYPLHLEVIMTNFQLMRGAGMTHVDAILRLMRMHPWTIRIPELEPYYHKFAGELAKFAAIDEDIRQYHRLLVSQSAFLFVSTDYRPLIAVAGDQIAEVEKTFAGYVYNKANYIDLVNKVREYSPQYAPTRKLTTLAEMLGIPDEPLPGRVTAADPNQSVAV